MTEAEWLACEDPSLMLEFLGERVSQRKLRLFACARCRQLWHFFTDERCRRAIEVAERFADQEATIAEFEAAGDAVDEASAWASGAGRHASTFAAMSVVSERPDYVGFRIWRMACNDYGPDAEETAALKAAADLEGTFLRDIFGNPFRPAALDPAWRTSTAVALASQMYESRDFTPMPILADALQDAGCNSDDVLNHCRGPGPHARGCWVVDLILGKV